MSHRGKSVTKSIREARRVEAGKRQEDYDKLTLQQKLDRLPPAPACVRQRTKLEAQLKAQQEKSVAKSQPQKPTNKEEKK